MNLHAALLIPIDPGPGGLGLLAMVIPSRSRSQLNHLQPVPMPVARVDSVAGVGNRSDNFTGNRDSNWDCHSITDQQSGMGNRLGQSY